MSHSSAFLHGVVPPVATPFTVDHEVDWASLQRLLRHLLEGGVHGLFLLGSTSECVLLTASQRQRVLEFCVAEIGARVPVVAGVMAPATDACIEHGLRARDAGVDALVLTAPFYTRTSQGETLDHFGYVQAATGLPLIAYDIPVCVGTKLQRETVQALVQAALIVGLKDSSGDEAGFRLLLRDLAQRPDIALLTGSELLVDTALLAGAHGCVPGLGNVDPGAYVRLYQAAQRGDWQRAREEQERLMELFQMVFWGAPELSPGAAGVGAFKTALMHMGIFERHTMRRPNRPVPLAVQHRIAEHLGRWGLL
jgi:4-hydroxy-tetrahydrodipicolinate synthase